MRKLATLSIAVIAIAMVLLAVFLAGCQQKTTSPPPPNSPSSVTTQGGVKVYSNATYGFSFTICNSKDFELQEKYRGTTVALAGPLLADFKHQIAVSVVTNKVPKNTKLEDYITAARKEAERTLKDFAITDERPTTISGIQAKLTSYTYTTTINEEDIIFKNTHVTFIQDNTLYAVGYESSEEFYDQYVECFNIVLSTFKFR